MKRIRIRKIIDYDENVISTIDLIKNGSYYIPVLIIADRCFKPVYNIRDDDFDFYETSLINLNEFPQDE